MVEARWRLAIVAALPDNDSYTPLPTGGYQLVLLSSS